jgi:hypothetical protein
MYTLFLSADGNFRLQRKHKRDDPDDVALNDGRAYFVENSNFLKYLEQVGDSPEVFYSLYALYNPADRMHVAENNLHTFASCAHAEHRKVQKCCDKRRCCNSVRSSWPFPSSGYGGSTERGTVRYSLDMLGSY